MNPEILTGIVLGLVQGITELLPVSSSAHLIIVSAAMQGKPLPLALNVALHLGTVMAVLVYFYSDWLAMSRAVVRRITAGTKSFGSDVLLPALIIGSATWATALATRRHVDTTPTTGANGRIFLTNPGKNLLVAIPIAIGARTTCKNYTR